MKTRIVHSKIWTDSFFLDLKPDHRYLFIYYLTNRFVNILHCYECPDTLVNLETGLPLETIAQGKKIFEQAGKINFYKGYVFLKNACKYESYTGVLNEHAKKKLAGEMAPDVLDWYNKLTDTPIYTPLKGTITHNTEHRTYNTEDVVGLGKKLYRETMNESVDPDLIPL